MISRKLEATRKIMSAVKSKGTKPDLALLSRFEGEDYSIEKTKRNSLNMPINKWKKLPGFHWGAAPLVPIPFTPAKTWLTRLMQVSQVFILA